MTNRIGVLIIEDSDAERFFLRRAIEKLRPACDVTEFAYAGEALDFLKQNDQPSLHCIFVDINMPRMDGFAFADAFHALSSERRGMAKLWLVSHSIDPLDRAQADSHPAITGFLSKAWQDEEIDRVLPRQATG